MGETVSGEGLVAQCPGTAEMSKYFGHLCVPYRDSQSALAQTKEGE